MRIWILAKQQKFDSYDNLRFQEVARDMGIELTMVAPEDCEIIATQEDRKSFFLNGEEVEHLPDCVVPRMGSGTTYFGLAVIRHLERMGVLVLNSDTSIETAKDKLATAQVLSAKNLPFPKTILAKSPLDLDIIEREFSYPVILKKVSGSEGKGIVMCENRTQLRDVSEMLNNTAVNLIVQECIRASLGRDIRVFVVGGRAVGAMLRTASPESFKANYSAGGSIASHTLTPDIEWLSVEAAKVIGLEIAGVDLLFDEHGYRVCEVNSSPYFEGFEEATGINIPKEIYNFVRVRLEGTALVD